MLTSVALDADRVVRRLTGRGLRRDRLDPAHADPTAAAAIETSVIRLPIELANGLHDLAAGIARAQPGQYVCPPESVHVTVCGPIHLAEPPAIDAAIADLREIATTLAGGRLKVVRIAVGDTSLFAGVEPLGVDLAGARGELARRWGVPARPGLAGIVARRLFWANLVRFTMPPSAGFIASADRHRRAVTMTFPIGAVELVRTNRAMAPAATTVLGRIEVPGLGPR